MSDFGRVLDFEENLLIVADTMADVEGIIDEVVVGERDTFGIASCSGSELDTNRVSSMVAQSSFRKQNTFRI